MFYARMASVRVQRMHECMQGTTLRMAGHPSPGISHLLHSVCSEQTFLKTNINSFPGYSTIVKVKTRKYEVLKYFFYTLHK